MSFKGVLDNKNHCFYCLYSVAHHLTVRRLSFRPVYGKAGEQNEDSNVLQLASCSADYSVRVYTLYLDKLKSF